MVIESIIKTYIFLILIINTKCLTSSGNKCFTDFECDSMCCQDQIPNNSEYDHKFICVEEIFCSRMPIDSECLGGGECHSDCCVGSICREKQFCYNRYYGPILNGISLLLILLICWIGSCYLACICAGRRKLSRDKANAIRQIQHHLQNGVRLRRGGREAAVRHNQLIRRLDDSDTRDIRGIYIYIYIRRYHTSTIKYSRHIIK